jgi:hypothetical protein
MGDRNSMRIKNFITFVYIAISLSFITSVIAQDDDLDVMDVDSEDTL